MYESTFLDAEKIKNLNTINREIVSINIKEQIENLFFCKDNNYLNYFNNSSSLIDTDDEKEYFMEQTTILYEEIKKILEEKLHISFGFESRILDNERKEFIEDVYTFFVLRFRKMSVRLLTSFIIANKDLCTNMLDVSKKKELDLVNVDDLTEEGLDFKNILNNINTVITKTLSGLDFTFDYIEDSLFDRSTCRAEDYSICEAYYKKDGIYLNIEDGFMLNFKENLLKDEILVDLTFDVRNMLFNLYKKK